MQTTASPLTIAGRTFTSRLIVGTGKYRTNQEMNDALEASGAEVVSAWRGSSTSLAMTRRWIWLVPS